MFVLATRTKRRLSPSVMLDKTILAGCAKSRAQRLGCLPIGGGDADPTPDRRRAELGCGANDDGFITSKNRRMLLLKLTVSRQRRDLRPITKKLNAPVGRWLRLDKGGWRLRPSNQFCCLRLLT